MALPRRPHGTPQRAGGRVLETMLSPSILWFVLVVAAAGVGLLLILLLLRPRVVGGADSERAVREELRAGREEAARAARDLRAEMADSLKTASDLIARTMREAGEVQKERLEGVTTQLRELSESNQARIDSLRGTIDAQLKQMQEGNEKKLDEMRRTVDEKLQTTLEKRLGESFRLVSERLEAVQKGLGEMQSLATGVGDLKRVLTNVKTRGTWGEVQLGSILEQLLTPDQFARNVQTKEGSRENVEFALRLPGRDGQPGSCVWLPIDSKFPQEDYLRLVEASEAADAEGVQKATAALTRAARGAAQEIESKYIGPPQTTDFALMFLPTEGLYAELLRQPGLAEELQRLYRVVLAGPTTLAALLNSLQMGFRTLAIEQRASEVWKVLAAVKTEFGKFGDVLQKVKKQLDTASRTIDATGARTRAMERKLRDVEQLPAGQAGAVLGLPQGEEPDWDDLAGAEDQEEIGPPRGEA
jgi:DNA recombination protein RmuC